MSSCLAAGLAGCSAAEDPPATSFDARAGGVDAEADVDAGVGTDGPVRPDAAPPSPDAAPLGPIGLAAGRDTTCVLDPDGGARCWGNKGMAVVDADADTPVPTRVPGTVNGRVLFGAGDHACVLRTDDSVACWGAFASVANFLAIGSAPYAIENLTGVDAFSLGSFHGCALRQGAAWCFGANQFGELGDTDLPSMVARRVPGLTGLDEIGAGYDFGCALDVGVGVWCWGRGDAGQLGGGTRVMRSAPAPVIGLVAPTRLRVGSEVACADTSAGWRCWGRFRATPEAINVPAGTSDLVVGGSEVCARVGDRMSCGAPFAAMQDVGLGGVIQLAIGNGHKCARTDAGVWCWGLNNQAQAGQPMSPPIQTPTQVPGL